MEVTIKSIKKLISHGQATQSTGTNFHVHPSSTGTPPVEKMDIRLHKNCSATQYRTLFPLTVDPLHLSSKDPVKKLIQSLHTHQKHPSPPTCMINMPTPCPTFRSATMLQCRTPPPNCGTSTELSQQLDHTGTTSSKHRVVASLSGTGHCQLPALHLSCHQTPLNPETLSPVVLPALPIDPFSYQRIQHGCSAPLLTHRR